jgi:hypothetical protein
MGSDGGLPEPVDLCGFFIAGPRGHGDAYEFKVAITDAAVLERSADRDVD